MIQKNLILIFYFIKREKFSNLPKKQLLLQPNINNSYRTLSDPTRCYFFCHVFSIKTNKYQIMSTMQSIYNLL